MPVSVSAHVQLLGPAVPRSKTYSPFFFLFSSLFSIAAVASVIVCFCFVFVFLVAVRGVCPRDECCSLFLFCFLSQSLREVSALAASAIDNFGCCFSERSNRVTNHRQPAVT